MSGIKQTALAVLIYAGDFDDRFPPAKNWRTASAAYGSMKSECPDKVTPFGYGFNGLLSALPLAEVMDATKTALVYEQDAMSPNASGGKSDISLRHGSRVPIARTDGSVHFYTPDLFDLAWKP